MDEQTDPQPAGDDAGLRELALALIAARYPDATDEANGKEPQLLPGQLPPTFPGDFPLPPGSRVVGSLVGARSAVVLDTDQSGEAVIAFYAERLTAAGWSAPEDIPPRQGGFASSGFGAMGRNYAIFYREDGPSLQVMTQTARNGRTSALISEMPANVGPMRHGPRSRMMHHDILSILPHIAPPPHSQQHSEGGGGGDDRVTSSARVETDLDLPALAAHYIAQLERGGWQRTDSGENDPVAWSAWTFESEDKEPWRALFITFKRPDAPRHYWAHLLAEWMGDRSQSDPHTTDSVLLGWQVHHQLKP